jgi:hypothetical protein
MVERSRVIVAPFMQHMVLQDVAWFEMQYTITVELLQLFSSIKK